MPTLKKDFQQVITYLTNPIFAIDRVLIEAVKNHLESIQDKPVKRLSSEQIRIIFRDTLKGIDTMSLNPEYKYARAIEEAHIKINIEPEEVPFDGNVYLKERGYVAIDVAGIEYTGALSPGINYKFMRRKS